MSLGLNRDVLVVGGGVIGLSVAWRLARAGHAVRVIERSVDGEKPRGASWVAAGMLAPVSEAGFGEEALLRLNRAALKRFPEAAAELEADGGEPVGLRHDGTLLVAWDGDDWAALSRLVAWRDSWGLATRRLGGRERRAEEPFLSPEVRGAFLVPEDLSVDNRRYLRVLTSAARRRGVGRVSGQVSGLLRDGDRVTGVRTDRGDAHADLVVLAAGSATGALEDLPAELNVPVRPVKGQILRLGPGPASPPGALIRRTVRALVRGREVYLVPREDGELVVGATMEERGADTTTTVAAVQELLADACDVVPGVRELALVECSAGLRPGTPDNGPLVGATRTPGLVLATGHYRNGVLLSALTADAVLAAVRGEPPAAEWRPFDPERFSGGVA